MKVFFNNNREIATPVCGLVRNDTVYLGDCHDQCVHWSRNDVLIIWRCLNGT